MIGQLDHFWRIGMRNTIVPVIDVHRRRFDWHFSLGLGFLAGIDRRHYAGVVAGVINSAIAVFNVLTTLVVWPLIHRRIPFTAAKIRVMV